MSTPTRIPETVPARRVALLATAAVLVTALALPVRAVDAAETTASLRAQRQVLVQRIAALTDEAARAQVRAVRADRAHTMSSVALDRARTRFARHAVDAYLGGVQDSEDEQLRRRVWADTLSDTDRRAVTEFRRVAATAEKDRAAAAVAADEASRLAAELDTARAQLERTINERDTYERASRSAARLAAASKRTGRSTRHALATGSQAELMRRYQFGPATGVPSGLAATGDAFEGRASWYGPGFDGRSTASGAIFDQEGWTVAHRTLPLGTILLITRGGRSVVVLVNDRGPFVSGRVLDLSHGVANYLGTVHAGVASVRAEILVPAPQ